MEEDQGGARERVRKYRQLDRLWWLLEEKGPSPLVGQGIGEDRSRSWSPLIFPWRKEWPVHLRQYEAENWDRDSLWWLFPRKWQVIIHRCEIPRGHGLCVFVSDCSHLWGHSPTVDERSEFLHTWSMFTCCFCRSDILFILEHNAIGVAKNEMTCKPHAPALCLLHMHLVSCTCMCSILRTDLDHKRKVD